MSPSDNSSFSPPVRQWSIRQANSRLYSQGLESALESDLTLQQLEEKNNNNNLSHIPMNHLTSTTENNNRQSNNPYKSFDTTNMSLHRLDSKGGYSQQHDPFAISPMEAWQEMKDYNLQVHGVPTLDQLLRLPTSNPITQTQFAHFLKRKGAQQNLNFLLELETHQRLWQAYLNSVERQQRPEMKSERTSKFLLDAASINDHSHNLQSQWSPTVPYFETSDTQDLLASLSSSNNHNQQQQQQNHSYASRTIQGDKSLSRHDLVQNAIRIYRTFCSRLDAAQPIHLPDDHKQCLENLIEQHQRPEPVIFEAARSHVFDVLNMFYYPQFIDAALYTNVSRLTARIYLMVGLILLTLGLALEFAFIFLNAGTTATRWWSFVPFLFSWASLLTGLTHFAWWSAWMKKSEISFMVYIAVEDKTAIRIQRKRAFIWCLANIIIAFINTCIFVFIPAHRL
ncbi:hypothetical protein BJ944DRAFT_243268 [Cunninghamella echinulata]|nr:hypothetical protein BJ944DRAFT_243268 [Cunninghamella echinulata]